MPTLTTYTPYTEDVSGAGSSSSLPASETTGEADAVASTAPVLPVVPNPVGQALDALRTNGPRLALHAGAVFLAFILIGVGIVVIAAPPAARVVREVAPKAAAAVAAGAL